MFGEMGSNDPLKKLLEEMQSEDSVIRAQMNDKRLMTLAEYDATKGFMTMKVEPETLQSRFAELKRLVQAGDMTLQQLEDDVYNRWGIQEQSREGAISKGLPSVVTGFDLSAIDVADMPTDSKENH